MTSLLRRRASGATSQAVAALVVSSLALSGCGSADDSAGAASDDGRLTVVASTDVWGSVVSAVAGDGVEVTSLIDDPSADPHSYESTPAEAADVLGADLVVYNGGGYDGFVPRILESEESAVPTVEAVATTRGDGHGGGHDHADHSHGRGNEHVWYDLATVEAVAGRVAEELSRLAPAQAATFTGNAEALHRRTDGLAARVSSIREQHAGTRVAVTEPIAFHLIEAAGLDDVTPPEFVQAIEEESDPPAAAVAETRRLVSGGGVTVLVFNPQARTPVTAQVRTEAERAGIPVVEMTETLPPDSDYIGWMSGQVDALERALRR